MCDFNVADTSSVRQFGFVKDGGKVFSLFTSSEALSHIDTIQTLRILLCLDEYGRTCLPLPCPPKRHAICNAITIQMQGALQNKNIGKWAQLLQKRVQFLPYSTHKGPKEVHRIRYVHRWFLDVTPTKFLCFLNS